MTKFYDTNALLSLLEKAFNEPFVICSKTSEEIEHIKVSDRKDPQVKYNARKVAKLIKNNRDKITTVIPNDETFKILKKFQLETSPDNIIMACAYLYNKKDKVLFISEDINCQNIAYQVFKLEVSDANEETDEEYTGYKEIKLNDTKLAYLYEHQSENTYDLLINQCLIVKNDKDEVVDKFRWSGEELIPIKQTNFKSEYFGTVKAYKNDVYQQCAMNCLSNCQITMLKGAAGTGKSYLALGYLFSLLEKHKIDKIIVFCNPVNTINAARLGFYKGTKDEKLLESNIGNILSSKLGGKFAVEELINDDKLILMPLSDIRGFDTTNMKAGIFITEAQNMDVSLMKLSMQRIGEDCICLVDGDFSTQVDMSQYAGANNGMRRLSEVFRGEDIYGEIELQNIYRSRIAKIANEM